ncbi:non-ribosomal peptide synthase/polyketide synthase [Archangium violaceum]|uniref:non-ribosomal peptide synthase/polyketide synthase n=1 Tax=Archangium violaceum TaxID=83451 RepID=UPI001951CFA3|nr:non-ribosomal peptide synthase/polyketide synthase [Archangium violaceum]QRN95171.1 non-ribosomal peptide synthase/polyketide synthase [Archangium violaceum]
MSDIHQRIAALSPEKRELLLRKLEKNKSQSTRPPLVARSRDGAAFPLSFAQQRLWFLDRLEPGSTLYNLPSAVRLEGALDAAVLERCLGELVRRHESLRTVFREEEGRAIQVLLPPAPLALPVTDLSALPASERDARVQRLAAEELGRPFELTRGPLLRARLLRLAEREHVLLLMMHHIVSDEWSMGVLVSEMGMLYAALSKGQEPVLPPLAVQYADYAVWQREWLQGEALEKQLAYWRQQLAGAPPVLELPTDRPRPAEQSFRGASRSLRLPPALLTDLKALCQREGVTLFMAVLAASQALLARYSGQDDICVGAPVSGRQQAELEGLIGFFVNTVVLRTRLGEDPTFRELLARVKEVTLGAYSHQDVPFERLVEELQPARNLSHSPLFQVMVDLQQSGPQARSLPGLKLSPVEGSGWSSKFDLTFSFQEKPEWLEVSLEYATDLFDEATAERLLGHLRVLLEGAVARPERRLSTLPLLNEAERRQVLEEYNRTRADFPSEACLHQLFAAQVERTPEAVALSFEGERVTYRELRERARGVARRLRALGVGPEVRVGLCMERSPRLVAAMLGVLEAGGAWVPMELSLPPERMAFMLEDSRARVLLTQQSLLSRLPEKRPHTLCLDAQEEQPLPSGELEPAAVGPGNVAYVIYTSGSTGQPKGVLVEHRGVCNLVSAEAKAYGVGPGSRMLQFSSASFDISVEEIFTTLTAGGTLCLARAEELVPGPALWELLRRQSITTLSLTPAALAATPSEGLPELKVVISGGEACSAELVRRWGAGRRFVNTYGPTEGTVVASLVECVDDGRVPPIGAPLANVQLYVLDAGLRPVPVGVAGELCLGGVGLARGYLGRPELTAEKFIPHPFGTEPGARLYRTGDRVRRRADGMLEFLGRIDTQVKVRGFRIELGEVEAVLQEHPWVREAVVVARGEAGQDKRLVGYVVGKEEGWPGVEGLREHLKRKLPEYMVPAAFVRLEALPLTLNGKVDRKALPAPEGVRPELERQYVAPRNDTEQRLAEVWAKVLGLDRVGVHDNFFALGGDSILTLQVVARARQVGVRVTPRLLFQRQTVAELAEVVGQSVGVEAWQGVVEGPIRLTAIQKWFLEQEWEEPAHFNQALLLEVKQPLDVSRLEEALQRVVEHHDALRMRFVRGEGGWRQENAGLGAKVKVRRVDLSGIAEEAQAHAVEEVGGEVQRSLELGSGVLLSAALIERGQGRSARLLLVAHHLVVDGVSWRVLVEDLERAYEQLELGQKVELPAKTTSFQEWAEKLWEYARGEELGKEKAYWQERTKGLGKLPVDRQGGGNRVASARNVAVKLGAEKTKALLQEVPGAYRARPEEVLLAGLAQVLAGWTKQGRVAVEVEGHGREEVVAGVDISRTVGWFTTVYPVVMEVRPGAGGAEAVRAAKEAVRRVPGKGLGYGLLRHVREERLEGVEEPQVSFNYLGQLDATLESTPRFGLALEGVGPSQSPKGQRSHLLDVTVVVVGGELRVTWTYSEEVHEQGTVERLAKEFVEALERVVEDRGGEEAGRYTGVDFPLAGLGGEELERVLKGREGVEEVYPLSPLQQGLLFHALMEPGTGLYVEQMSWEVNGALEVEAFRGAWNAVVDRTAVLRTSFVWEGLEEPRQVVQKRVALPFEERDWRGLSAEEQERKLQEYLREDQARGFELGKAPLMRVALMRVGEKAYRCVWTHHHLLLDGWSLGLLFGELFTFYGAFSRHQDVELGRRPEYREYIAWLQRQGLGDAEAYWREQLKGFRAPTPLPLERRGGSEAHGEVGLELTKEETSALQAYAQKQQVTVNTLVQGAWALVLSRHAGEEDVVFGATVAGRPPELEGVGEMVGLFINTLPVRVKVDGGERVESWLKEMQRQQAEQRQYEHSPLVRVQGWSEVARGTPLFESLLVFENYPVDASLRQRASILDIRDVRGTERTNYALTAAVLPGDALRLKLAYSGERFEESGARELLGQWKAALQGLVANTERRVVEVEVLTEQERQRVLVEWNQTEVEYPSDTVVAEFERQVEARRGAVAVEFGEERLTYGELEERANRLAQYLRKRGVGAEARVALCVERGVELVVALVGIVKAGGCYVPLEASYPRERLEQMVGEAQAGVVVTESKHLGVLPVEGRRVVVLDLEKEEIGRESAQRVESGVGPRNLAYIDFTSGSTGKPKGVCTEHRGVLRTVKGVDYAHLGPQETFLLIAPVTFDASTLEVWGSLLNGGRLVVYPPQPPGDVKELEGVLKKHGVTTLHLTAGLFAQMVEGNLEGLRGVRQLLTGGDVVSAPHVRRVLGELKVPVTACYGPTESTLFTSCWRMEEEGQEGAVVPIGRPIGNTQVYVLDEHMRPVAVGVRGELYVGGDGLARGYLANPEQTAEKFVPSPFSTKEGERLYRTGDVVRWRGDGVLEFLGRQDTQVKVRGFRIELGEVEGALLEHPWVKEAVVVARGEGAQDKRLVGYVVGGEEGWPGVEGLREHMKKRVPEYMVPSAFMRLEAMPLTPNGKVDRKALPALEAVLPERQYVAPRNDTEQRLAEVWAQVLGVEKVGIHDDFFELGGHSLLATQAISRIRLALDVELPLRTLFEARTVEGVAARLGSAGKADHALALSPLRRVDRDRPLPLSFAQQRLWFLDQLMPGNALYGIPAALRLEGQLDVAALEASFKALAARHEVLRTTFQGRDGQVFQVIAPEPLQRLEVVDLTTLPESEREAAALRHASEEAQRPFDLARGPLLRTLLLKLGESVHALVLTVHHIISDAWSTGILVRELVELYDAAVRRRQSQLPELPVQYADFAAWQREWLKGETLETQLDWWRQQLAGVPHALELPTDRPRPAVQSFRGAHLPVHLPKALAEALQTFCRAEGVTPFMVLLATYQTLLHRYSGQDDLLVGTTIAGRRHAESERLIGFFANTLVLRARMAGDPSFRELLHQVRETTLGAHAHQEIPFERLVEELQPKRDLSRSPLFQALFTLQNSPRESLRVPGLAFEPLPVENPTSNFDLALELTEDSEGFSGYLEYCTDLFDESTVTRMVGHLRTLLEGALASPRSRLSELPLMTRAEQRQSLVEWNGARRELPQPALAHRLFEAQARRTPDAPAVRLGSEQLTYGELNARANQLARHLRRLGVGPEVIVSLCLDRSQDLVVAMLATLKAGGAWLPLDPSLPSERLDFIASDAWAPVLITHSELEYLLDRRGHVFLMDEHWARVEREDEGDLEVAVDGDNLAYVIYTSGSTGRPKGTLLRHEALCNTALLTVEAMALRPGGRALQFASIGFDASVWEILPPLMAGGCLVLASSEERMPGAPLQRLLREQAITAATLTPSVLAQLDPQGLEGLEALTSAGEACTPELVTRWKPGRRFINAYGPTESTICATLSTEVDPRRISIGRPFQNVQVYVLDAHLQPQPVGVPGELYIGGAGLARGYLGRPELTAERFVPDCFGGRPGARLYRTGDKVRWLPDGSLEFLGRLDFQVKVRGFRIELGEVESVLLQHPSVREAVVVVREDVPGDKRLVAYVVDSGDAEPAALRTWLQEKLPEYMVPSAFVTLEALPLNSSGKVDRNALPVPSGQVSASGSDYVAPSSELEQRLASIWTEVLGVERVGLHDDFFDLGGHSLVVTQAVSRIRDAFGVELPMREFFAHPTLARLSPTVAALVAAGTSRPTSIPPQPRGADSYPTSFAQQRLWFLEQLEPGLSLYNVPLTLGLTGQLDVAALERGLLELCRRHESLRTSFRSEEGRPVQVVSQEPDLTLVREDLREVPEALRQERALQRATEEARRPFELERGPLVRALLLRLGEQEHLLQLTLHHAVTDGWSLGVLVRELVALYEAASAGRPSPLPPLPLQYVDYAAWQREWLQGPALEAQLSYWRTQLEGVPPVLELPTDRPRPAVQTYRGAYLPLRLPRELSQRLVALAQQHQATPFMALLAAFQLLLHRYSGQEDISVGSPIAGRQRSELEGVVGFFVNTLVLRSRFHGDPSFLELLGRVRETTQGAYAHQDIPFEKLVDQLQPVRSLGHSPLIQVMFTLQNAPMPPLRLPGLVLRDMETESKTARFDLILSLSDGPEGFGGSLGYNSDLFDEATISRMAGHLRTLLEGVVSEPERPLSSLPLLTEQERARVLGEWNETREPFAPACFHDLFEAQVERTPEAVAVVYEEDRLTYRELDARANALAWHLRSLGVGPEVLVGLYLERSVEAIVGMLGILKAGGAYVPLDPTHPSERLRTILEEARASVLVTQRPLLERLVGHAGPAICLDTDGEVLARQSSARPPPTATPGNLVYAIFTSGSTGRPKGVAIEHRQLTNYLRGVTERLRLEPGLGFASISTLAADLGNTSIFPTLCHGGTLHLLSRDRALEPGALADYFNRHAVEGLKIVPTHLGAMLSSPVPEWVLPRRRLVLGGDRLDWALVDRVHELAPQCEVFNHYGPTETTVGVLTQHVPRGGGSRAGSSVPLGRPIPNVRTYLLDAHLQPVPVGVPGELYIGGDAVGRGYLGRSDLTAERFVPDLFSPEPGGRLYRSGDRARYLPDGSIEFLGRVDHQLKIRGFRVELGEIEAVVEQYPPVREAVVVAREDTPGDKRLVAYVVPREPGRELPVAELRAFLRDRLPEYMVPPAFVMLGSLPLSPNGKVDRKALPAPEATRGRQASAYVPPTTSVEITLAGIWAQVLGVERVGLDDNFFDLGGDSLKGLRVVALASRTGLAISPKQLFQHQRLGELAAVAGTARLVEAEQGAVVGPLTLTPNQHMSFETEDPDRHMWNISSFFQVDVRLEPELLREVVRHVLLHHDALRVRSIPGPDGWRQLIAPPGDDGAFAYVDLTAVPDEQSQEAIEREAARLQQSLNLVNGPVMRLALFDLGPDRPCRLLLLAHHTLCDGYSFPILWEDCLTVYTQLRMGEPVQLPPKTTSLRAYADRMVEVARTREVRQQADYWLSKARREVGPLPEDFPGGLHTGASARTVSVVLDAELTGALQQAVSVERDIRINDLLLTALAESLTRWSGQRSLLVDLEDHGRDVLEHLDLSRTVGWINYLVPLLLEVEEGQGPVERLQAVREQLRAVPERGIGHGMLRYLCGDEELMGTLRALPQPRVLFNYRGGFTEQSQPETTGFRVARESSGLSYSLRVVRRHLLMVNCRILRDKLHMDWVYSENVHRRSTVERLAEDYRLALAALVGR